MTSPSSKSDPPTADDIAGFVDNGDMALELSVYRAFKENGWWANHGHFYIDPIKEIPRQFDVQGGKDLLMNPEMPTPLTTGVRIAAECKNVNPAAPVIVSRVPRSESESYHCLISRQRQSNGAAHTFVLRSSPSDLTPYRLNDPVGKFIVQYEIKQNKAEREDPYAKWSQALASCGSLIVHAHAEALSLRTAPDLSFIVPALVLPDRALWTVDYDEDGDCGEPMLTDEATFYVGRDYSMGEAYRGKPSYWISHLHIYTMTGFVKALQTLNNRQNGRELDRYFQFGIPHDE